MSDGGTNHDESAVPDGVPLPDGGALPDATGPDIAPADAVIPPAEAVIPPPPPETPVPEGLLAAPADTASDVVPPTRRSERSRPTPAILQGAQPAAAADDWSQRSVAPEAPQTGSYRVLAGVIFAFLFLLLAAALVTLVVLITTVGLPFAGGDPAAGLLPLRT
ncbi:hypothetical protein [Microbacterium sp. BLY]|uniref:hypothetical protein n=1 Tax=Microbacterium sp. BLY TaxID=2823280 RepID=UPI001B331E37|nr:hypothetical protein [Microbacterium sp. BLY]MBP3976705.1 hypothetical protein [Microbacterium sp. BLY]